MHLFLQMAMSLWCQRPIQGVRKTVPHPIFGQKIFFPFPTLTNPPKRHFLVVLTVKLGATRCIKLKSAPTLQTRGADDTARRTTALSVQRFTCTDAVCTFPGL